MNRAELRQLAEDRILDAEALLAVGRWSGAYYLAGYAVECGLKACILALVEREGVILEDKKFSEKCFTHNFDVLVTLAKLDDDRNRDRQANSGRNESWKKLAFWNEASRYNQKTQLEAVELYEAVTNPSKGVMTWMKGHW